uniref:Putative tail fiber n=1 Tax=uncultured marine virus TaxID=186617 RepID=A0A0F7LBJ0_9VIRU|nr:putative tail fiber [uncultured marine virus]
MSKPKVLDALVAASSVNSGVVIELVADTLNDLSSASCICWIVIVARSKPSS